MIKMALLMFYFKVSYFVTETVKVCLLVVCGYMLNRVFVMESWTVMVVYVGCFSGFESLLELFFEMDVTFRKEMLSC